MSLLLSGPMLKLPAGGTYTPEYVDNQGNAYFSTTSNFASDSVFLWLSGHFNFSSDGAGATTLFFCDARSYFYRSNTDLRFQVKNTSNVLVLDITTPALSAGTLRHLYFYYDGTGGTGGWKFYVDGSDVSGSCTVNTAWAAGTVDHTRASTSILSTIDVQQIGDLMMGATTPPAIGDLYSGGPVDPTSVTATVKVSGVATVWNAGPAGYTVNNTFIDA